MENEENDLLNPTDNFNNYKTSNDLVRAIPSNILSLNNDPNANENFDTENMGYPINPMDYHRPSVRKELSNNEKKLSDNIFLKDYNFKKEMDMKMKYLLSKVQIDTKSTILNNEQYENLIERAKNFNYYYEYSKLYQFLEIQQLKANINNAISVSEKLNDQIPEMEMNVENIEASESGKLNKLPQLM